MSANMKQATITTKVVAQKLSFLRWGCDFCVVIVLILTTDFSGKASGQYFPMEQPEQQTIYSHSPYSSYSPYPLEQQQPYFIIPQSAPEEMFSSSPLPPYDNIILIDRNAPDDRDWLATRNLTISRDSRMILPDDPWSQKPPKWDFSFPRCQSFNRSKPSMVEDTWHNPSEPFFTGCYRRAGGELGKIRSDFRNFYSRENFANILVAYGVHAVISNTAMDQHLVNWYQDSVRSSGTDGFSAHVRDLGTGMVIAPIAVVGTLYYCDRITDRVRFFETRGGSFLGEFASRATRAYLVGAPTMLFSQILIGAGRPNNSDSSSRWQPFQYDKGVSGHAFAGAIPFITLAQMSDNFWMKTGFYTCSTFVAWSRFNDNAHYFSQILVGWYLTYLSCRAVSKTEYQLLPRGLTIFPVIEPRTTGIGLVYQW